MRDTELNKKFEDASLIAKTEKSPGDIIQSTTARGRLVLRAIESDMRHELNENPELRNAQGFDFSNVDEPKSGSSFDARIDLPELLQTFPDQDPSELLMYGAMVSGVRLGDSKAGQWARLAREYSPQLSHFYITGEFERGQEHPRRLSLRVIPDNWEDKKLATPFEVTTTGDHLLLNYTDENGEPYTVGTFNHSLPADVPRLAYRREGRQNGDNGIVINPIMTCPHRCTFCSRQYDSLNKYVEQDDKTVLAVLTPEEIVQHVTDKWPDLDWKNTQRLSLVTGSFTTFDAMHNYIEKLRSGLREASNDNFHTDKDSNQEILVLTHLARTPEQFRALKNMGVTVQDTIEVFDDQRREEVMPRASKRAIPKYYFTQEDILNSIPDAVSILGDGYRATVVLGLDDFQTTVKGFERMREAGLQRLYYPTFQPYGYKDVSLYNMNLKELLCARVAARESFSQVY